MRTIDKTLGNGGALLTALLILTSQSPAQNSSPGLATLYSFKGSPNDGRDPIAGIAIGSGGVLYSTTFFGGASGLGTVFSLTPPASPGAPWTESVLHSFAGGAGDGAQPDYTGVAVGSGGVLYGLTYLGGPSNTGTVFSLTPPASPGGAWNENLLYSFGAPNSSQYFPESTPVIGSGGVLYGTAQGGTANKGVVFSLTPPSSPGGPWIEAVIYSFLGAPSDGAGPYGGLVIASDGVIYGTTESGGSRCAGDGCGTVFSLAPPASPGGPWTETVLYNFAGLPVDGYAPTVGVAIGNGGVLYGTTNVGGTGPSCVNYGCGTVFSLSPLAAPGGAWTETVIHNFTGGSDGGYPWGGVAVGTGGVLYGTTQSFGASNLGVVFSLTPPASPGGAWTENVLYSFTGPHGNRPEASVVIGPGDLLYGTTEGGGSSHKGTVFALKP